MRNKASIIETSKSAPNRGTLSQWEVNKEKMEKFSLSVCYIIE